MGGAFDKEDHNMILCSYMYLMQQPVASSHCEAETQKITKSLKRINEIFYINKQKVNEKWVGWDV